MRHATPATACNLRSGRKRGMSSATLRMRRSRAPQRTKLAHRPHTGNASTAGRLPTWELSEGSGPPSCSDAACRGADAPRPSEGPVTLATGTRAGGSAGAADAWCAPVLLRRLGAPTPPVPRPELDTRLGAAEPGAPAGMPAPERPVALTRGANNGSPEPKG
jgi:hypothetical protein